MSLWLSGDIQKARKVMKSGDCDTTPPWEKTEWGPFPSPKDKKILVMSQNKNIVPQDHAILKSLCIGGGGALRANVENQVRKSQKMKVWAMHNYDLLLNWKI